MTNIVTLFAMFSSEDPSEAFPIDIDITKTIGHLKAMIKDANPLTLKDVEARKLRLLEVALEIPLMGRAGHNYKNAGDRLTYATLSLGPAQKLIDVFGNFPSDTIVHIMIDYDKYN
ncbi:hypothetical protein BGX24_003698 [Mortierella sp. AD032]|nr:hypothetical protein BGX24_003698 [Mortierella sp. AD032]